MRRAAEIIALTLLVYSGSAWAGPVGSASGPITVDSTTFVPAFSVMGTDGGVYGDFIPPVAGTTTAAFRMTAYRGQHVNLRNNAGVEIGTNANPVVTTSSISVTIGAVSVTNSSFSVTGSTVNIAGTVPVSGAFFQATQPVSIAGTPNVRVTNSSFSVTGSTMNVNVNGTVPVSGTFWQATQPVSIASPISANATVLNVATVTVSGTPSVTLGAALPAGSNNVGTVSGSTVSVSNTVNSRSVNVSTVVVQSMPAVTVSLSTVTITNSSFSIVGVSSVSIVNPTLTTQLTGTLPPGANNIGTVTGSTVAVTGNVNATVVGTPSVNVSAMPNVTQPTPANLKSSVYIAGSSNTVQAQQSGTWNVNSTGVGVSSVAIQGTVPVSVSGTPTVNAQQSGSWTVNVGGGTIGVTGSTVTVLTSNGGNLPVVVNNSPRVYVATTSVSINGSSNTVTAAQSIPANLQVSASINGSSNTVQAAQSGAWDVTSTAVNVGTVTISGTPRVYLATTSVSINGSSNTVTAAQATPASLQASVSINGSSNTVASTQSGTWTVQPGNTQNTTPWLFLTTATVNTSAAQSGVWTNTVTQGTNSNLRASVDIDGSSNTVVLGAGTANVGKVVFQTPTTSALTHAAISFSSTGDNVIVSTASSQTVRVFRMFFVTSAATTITIKSGGATNMTGAMSFTANGSFTLDFSGDPWFVTTSGQGLIFSQTGTAQVSGAIDYTQS